MIYSMLTKRAGDVTFNSTLEELKSLRASTKEDIARPFNSTLEELKCS